MVPMAQNPSFLPISPRGGEPESRFSAGHHWAGHYAAQDPIPLYLAIGRDIWKGEVRPSTADRTYAKCPILIDPVESLTAVSKDWGN